MPMPDENPPVTRAMRLIFEFEGERVALISQKSVDVAVTGYDLSRAQHPGYYVDTRNADGDVLTRVHARNAFSDSVEVFPENAGEPIARIEAPGRRGAFTVIVPVPDGSDHVAVVHVAPASHSSALAPGQARAAAVGGAAVTDIAQFPLLINP